MRRVLLGTADTGSGWPSGLDTLADVAHALNMDKPWLWQAKLYWQASRKKPTTPWARRTVDRMRSTISDSEALDPFNVVANSFVKVSLHLGAKRLTAGTAFALCRCALLCVLVAEPELPRK